MAEIDDTDRLAKHLFSIFCQIRAGAKGEDIKLRYKIVCKDIKRAVRSARLSYESSLVAKCKHEPKMLYSYINNQKACNLATLIKLVFDSFLFKMGQCNRQAADRAIFGAEYISLAVQAKYGAVHYHDGKQYQ